MNYQTTSKRALGIDPGLANCGWAVVGRKRKGKFVLLESGTLQTGKETSESARLLEIYQKITERIFTSSPNCVVVRVFFTEPVTSCLTTAGVAAICVLSAEQVGIASRLVTPQQVKMAVTGHGRASRQQVQRMVATLTSREIKNADAADAGACAIAGVLRGNKVSGKSAG